MREWHPTKNSGLDPAIVTAGSGRLVWWRCSADPTHEWRTAVEHRARRGWGCPACSNGVVTPATSLLGTHPTLAVEWHKTKNGKLTPAAVFATSREKVWWRCSQDRSHVWQTSLELRAKRGSGCPACRRRVVTPKTSLAASYPDLVRQWHPTKNGALTPRDVLPGTERKVWWCCPNTPEHDWLATVVGRTGRRTGCPFCVRLGGSPSNSLKARAPRIALQWHPTKNGARRPELVPWTSRRRIWWRCLKNRAHEWQCALNLRTTKDQGCPSCAAERVARTTSLAARRPLLSADWHPTKNASLAPKDVTLGSDARVWWLCPKNRRHVWRAAVKDRALGGTGCPMCANKQVCADNSLRARRPALAREWHPTKNGVLTARDVVPGSNEKVWWQCRLDLGHEWQTFVYARSAGTGCPHCYRASGSSRHQT